MSHQHTWHGHSNFELITAGKKILIDPFFTGNSKADAAWESLGQVDLVLVTHDHQDHVGQTLEICRASGAKLLAIVETAAKLVELGLPQSQVVNGIGANIGGSLDICGIKVKMVQAQHSSESGLPVGYILTLNNGYCLYHAGDTGIFSSMQLFGRLHQIDLALLPIGGVFTMDPAQAALACELLACAQVVPMHWGTFPVLEKNLENFKQALSASSAKTRLLEMAPGQSLELKK